MIAIGLRLLGLARVRVVNLLLAVLLAPLATGLVVDDPVAPTAAPRQPSLEIHGSPGLDRLVRWRHPDAKLSAWDK